MSEGGYLRKRLRCAHIADRVDLCVSLFARAHTPRTGNHGLGRHVCGTRRGRAQMKMYASRIPLRSVKMYVSCKSYTSWSSHGSHLIDLGAYLF